MTFILCLRPSEKPASEVVTGTSTDRCCKCATMVWVGPGVWADPLCIDCAEKIPGYIGDVARVVRQAMKP